MKLLLKAIEFGDYRNTKNGQKAIFESVSTLVGANESGKTNILTAISRLKSDFVEQDTKIGSSRKANKQTPRLTFFFIADGDEVENLLSKKILNFDKNDPIGLMKEGGSFSELVVIQQNFTSKKLNLKNHWKNTSGQVLAIQTASQKIELQPDEVIIGDKENSRFIASLVRKKQLTKVDEQEVIKELIGNLVQFIPEVENWKYKEKELYVPNSVIWEEFLQNPDASPSVKKLFIVAGKENKELENFQQILQGLKGQSTDIQNFLNKIHNALNVVIKRTWSQSTLELQLAYEADKLRIDTLEGGELKPPDVRSEGVKWFLSFLLDFRSRGELEGKIILLDQPGERLHPGGQKELIERFQELSEKNQVIYATQSPFLVDRNNWSRVQFLKRLNGDAEIKTPEKEDVENDELLRHSLGYTLADVGQANEFNIAVEGYTDKYILLGWVKELNKKNIKDSGQPLFNLNRYAILDKHGRGSLHKAVDELTQAKLSTIGLFDGDREGKSSLREAKKDVTLQDQFFSFDELSGNKNCKTAEDFIPEEILMTAVKKTFRKKRANKNILKKPRGTKIKSWYKHLFKKELDSREKEKLWENIKVLFEEFLSKHPDPLYCSESGLAEEILKNSKLKLDSVRKKIYGSSK